MLVKVIVNSILLVTVICAIDDKFHDAVLDIESLVALGLLFVSQFMDEIISCLASQSISDAMNNLEEAIQDFTSRKCTEYLHLNTANGRQSVSTLSANNELSQGRLVEDIEYRCLQHICSMKNSFGYSTFGFDLRTATIAMIISNVCNYSIIIIQTTDLET